MSHPSNLFRNPNILVLRVSHISSTPGSANLFSIPAPTTFSIIIPKNVQIDNCKRVLLWYASECTFARYVREAYGRGRVTGCKDAGAISPSYIRCTLEEFSLTKPLHHFFTRPDPISLRQFDYAPFRDSSAVCHVTAASVHAEHPPQPYSVFCRLLGWPFYNSDCFKPNGSASPFEKKQLIKYVKTAKYIPQYRRVRQVRQSCQVRWDRWEDNTRLLCPTTRTSKLP